MQPIALIFQPMGSGVLQADPARDGGISRSAVAGPRQASY
ncbi:MAG: hypothetical protein AVDCRST_MAG15-2244 [uncultured Rubellimicrobium sp.]|uniref:Uncharacterized protein n=1 Tax=uncultured Rubellimicrobium sp. TaxID=543078 RepID=A0A6J4PRR3_9RHOB|nr:MAG: hypothetical protein AVDCRST_MAG15-2244 [uncultured Rubellimicrobium sp.]